MRRRQMLAASAALALPGCDGEGPVTGGPGADWRTHVENARRASELLSDPQRALALMPQAVRDVARRINQPWAGDEIGLAQTPRRERFGSYDNIAFSDADGLTYRPTERQRSEWSADGNTFLRQYPVLARCEILFRFPAMPLLRFDTNYQLISRRFRGEDNLIRYTTTAIHRLEGGIRPDQVGSTMVLERQVQNVSPATLQPTGSGARITESWRVTERLTEAVFWRRIVEGTTSSANDMQTTLSDFILRGDHVLISYRITGAGRGFATVVEGFDYTRTFQIISGIAESLSLERLVLTPAGQQRLQATRDAAERRIEDIAARARGVPAANRARATGLFQTAFSLWQSGNFNGAISGFNEGLDLDVGNGRAHYYLADSYAKLPLENWQHDVRRAARLLRWHHLRLATLLAPADSREGIMARTELQRS